MKETILAAWTDISSHPSFSRRITSGSVEFCVFGRMGAPEGPKPRIYRSEEMRVRSGLRCDIMERSHLHPNTGSSPSFNFVFMPKES
jgi:hypothetical protein